MRDIRLIRDVGVSQREPAGHRYLLFDRRALKRVQLGRQYVQWVTIILSRTSGNSGRRSTTATMPPLRMTRAGTPLPPMVSTRTWYKKEVLDYYPGDYNNARTSGIAPIDGVNTSSIVGTESYSGTIKAMSWYSTKPSGLGGSNAATTCVYNYDPKCIRLIASTWGTGLNFGIDAGRLHRHEHEQRVDGCSGTGTPGNDGTGHFCSMMGTVIS